MAGRRHLSPEERAAWEAVARTVKPLRPRAVKAAPVVKDDVASFATAIDAPKRVKGRVPPMRIEQAVPPDAAKGERYPAPMMVHLDSEQS